MTARNIFATVLTYPAPSSNYRGESEENRTVLQKITQGRREYTVISPESMRNALREIVAQMGLPTNRSRLHNEQQLAVEFKEFPNAEKYADDYLFGFLVADKKAVKANKDMPYRRDSVLRMNMAVALSPYRFDAMLNQSPVNAGESPWKNASKSALLHREVVHTAYQYPFALPTGETLEGNGPEWVRGLLEAIGQLSNVAGGHARSFFEMSPRSIVARLTPGLVAGFNTYGFDEDGQFTELDRLMADDLPGEEFWLGGELVRTMGEGERTELMAKGVHLYNNPQKLLSELGDAAYGAR